jgi:hypothetical protein
MRIAAKLAFAAHSLKLLEEQDSDYVFKVFEKHLVSSGSSGRPGLVGLEMGPGDSAASVVAAKAMGFFSILPR